MKYNFILIYFLANPFFLYSQTQSRHLISVNMGAGANFIQPKETECTNAIYWSMNAMYQYTIKEKYLLGFMYAGDAKGFNRDKLFKKLDNDITNFGANCIQSSQMYFSTFMFGPTFGIAKTISKKTNVYITASSGLVITVKQPIEATYYPYNPSTYSQKYFIIGGNKNSFSPFIYGTFGIRFSLIEDLSLNLYYAIDYFQANIGGVYSEREDNKEIETTYFQDKFKILEHSLGIGISFSPGK